VDYHMAFTAETGQVADMHDIIEITTRYLAAGDKDTDDSKFTHLSSGAGIGNVRSLLHLGIFFLGLTLTAASGYWLYGFYQSSEIDEVSRVKPLNRILLQHYILHVILTFMVLFAGHWALFLANLPLIIWRFFSYFTHSYTFTPGQFRGGGFGLNKVLGTLPRLFLDFIVYLIFQPFYLAFIL